MTVTRSYAFQAASVFPVVDSAGGADLVDLDFTSLADGGVAYTGLNTGTGNVEVGVYDAAGAGGHTYNPIGTGSAIAQLANGNLVLATTHSDGVLWYEILDSSGTLIANRELGTEGASRPAIAAMQGGGFMIGCQLNINANNNDVLVLPRGANGSPGSGGHFMDISGANDRNVAIVGVYDGYDHYAAAFDRTKPDGRSQVYVEVRHREGDIVSPVRRFDAAGAINREISAAKSEKGGFALAYEDSEATGSTSHITVARFNARGNLQGFTDVNAGDATHNYSQAAITLLPTGLLAVSYTVDAGGPNANVELQLISPHTGAVLLATPLAVAASAAGESASTLAAIGTGELVMGYSDAVAGSEAVRMQMVRTSTGDGAPNAIAGDAMIDLISGGGAKDRLYGGLNNDVLAGDGGNDRLYGGEGADSLDGGAGRDRLTGEGGQDVMTGGADGDTFDFDALSDSAPAARDEIVDLGAQDVIDLRDIDAKASTPANEAFILVAAFTGQSGQAVLTFHNSGPDAGKTTLELDVDGDASSDMTVLLQGDQHTFSNFVL